MLQNTLLLSLAAGAAAGCLECVRAGASWQADACQVGDCPIMDIGCATTVEACATMGCRAPQESYFFSAMTPPASCASCCVPDDGAGASWTGQCVVKSWTGGETSDAEPWYNAVAFDRARACASDCPPCATCLARDELELRALSPPANCSFSSCGLEDDSVAVDPCFLRASCECFCERARGGLASCPHLADELASAWERAAEASEAAATSAAPTRPAAEAAVRLQRVAAVAAMVGLIGVVCFGLRRTRRPDTERAEQKVVATPTVTGELSPIRANSARGDIQIAPKK